MASGKALRRVILVILSAFPTCTQSQSHQHYFAEHKNTSSLADKSSGALYYHDQLVNHLNRTHFGNAYSDGGDDRWTQRYYSSSEHFGGPGSPIFLVCGGEEAMDHGLYYPFVNEDLAERFSAYVLQPEHRFYGSSQPLGRDTTTNDLLARLLTPEQAMLDYVRLLRHVRTNELGCSVDRTSPDYCPVVTVGGSYPGFLSAMMRFVHPDVVDASYAASAPIKFYAQQVGQEEYYDLVTRSAERTSPSCPSRVRDALMEVVRALEEDVPFQDVACKLRICPGSIPNYIRDSSTFRDEVMMIVGYTFANRNMANYPPDGRTELASACRLFEDENLTSFDKVGALLNKVEANPASLSPDEEDDGHGHHGPTPHCFNMSSQLPDGPRATITGGDWSGDGTGNDGRMWDFQTCSLLVEAIGFSDRSMFPPRAWSVEWLRGHCRSRFDVVPRPHHLAERWGFDDLAASGASRILFTNGLNDGWSVGAVKRNLSGSILALNFENGAHHSDLSHAGPTDRDTEDVKEGHIRIARILGHWLDEVRNLTLTSAID